MKKYDYAEVYKAYFGERVNFVPKEDFKNDEFLMKVYNACHKNKMNQIILVTGLPRTGKSELCLWLAWQLDRNKEGKHLFNPREQVAFDITKCSELIEKFDDPGRVIIWEEAGVAGHGASARKWQQEENIQLNNIFQIMGLKRQIVIINLPAQFFLDKGVRSLAHWQIFTENVDVNNKVCVCRIRQVKLLPEKNEVRYIKLKYFNEKVGRVIMEKGSWIPRPPLHVRQEYYMLEKANKPKWIQESIDAIKTAKANAGKDNRVGVKNNLSEQFSDVVDNPSDFWDYSKDKPDVNAIMIRGNLSKNNAYAIANLWKRDVDKGVRNV